MAAGLALSLFPAVAGADTVVADGDGVTPVTRNDLDLGTICTNARTRHNLLVVITRSGDVADQMFANGTTVAVDSDVATPAHVVNNRASINLPGDWESLAPATQSGALSVSIEVFPRTVGADSALVSFRATGDSAAGGVIVRSDGVRVSWNAVSCNTAPTLTLTGVTNGASYDKGSVPAATCNVVDAEDGSWSFGATLSAVTGTYASDGIGSQTASCTFTDSGHLSATPTSATYSIADPTAPTISPSVIGTRGANGWFTSDVTITWTVADIESANSIVTTGCASRNITVDQGPTTYSCAATSAGGSSSAFTAVKRDATKPTISAGLAPAANADGWNNTDVDVAYSCADNLSGVATGSCGPDQTLTDEGPATPYSGIAIDNAGNRAEASGTVKIDKTAPSIAAGLSSSNGNGWNNTDVAVAYTCTDRLSGVAAGSCGPNQTLTAQGAAVPYSGTVVDVAGNSRTASGTIRIDKTAPSVSVALSPVANGAGWNHTNVVAKYSCSDGLSRVASCGPDQTLSTEGASVAYSGTAIDNAGNNSPVASGTVKIDKTAPSVSVTGVANGGVYVAGSVPVPGCATTDSLSGVATSASLSSTGGPFGSVTATCSGAIDVAGNAGSTTATYSVVYAFTGFFKPVDNLPALNVSKAGSAIPLKFSLGGNQGLGVIAAGFPTSQTVTCGSSASNDLIVETVTAGASSLTYDAIAGQYIYVWKTDKTWAGTCRILAVKLADGTIHQANFKLT